MAQVMEAYDTIDMPEETVFYHAQEASEMRSEREREVNDQPSA